MSKRSAADDDEPAAKRVRLDGTAPLADELAWRIMEDYLTSNTSYPQMEDAFSAYLGQRYRPEDWKEARDALFSGDGDDSLALTNLQAVKAKHVQPTSGPSSSTPADSSGEGDDSLIQTNLVTPGSANKPRRTRQKNPFLDIEAGVNDGESDDDIQELAGGCHAPQNVTRLPGAKHAFSAAIDMIQGRYANGAPGSSQVLSLPDRMYLFHVHRAVVGYVAARLQKQGIPATVSPWASGQLYVVADSPRTIIASLPYSHQTSIEKWFRIDEEQRAQVEGASRKLPNRSWVRIKRGKYKGDIAYVFDPDQSNNFVAVLVPPRDFPYPMPKRSASLFDRTRIPADKSISDVLCDGAVVGYSFKGEEYYEGLLKKAFHRYSIEHVSIPHPDSVRLHLQSGFDIALVKKAEIAFALQMLRSGDCVRLLKGELSQEIATVLSVDHTCGGSLRLEISLDGHPSEIQARLQDVERIFRVGDEVKVVAGDYIGVQGHIVQKTGDIFDVCQHSTNAMVQVSQYYLDRRPVKHSLHGQVPPHQFVEPPAETETIEIGDLVEVQAGKHVGISGVVEWRSPQGTLVWLRDDTRIVDIEDDEHFGPPLIEVPSSQVQRAHLPPTLTFNKDRGYDVRPGDFVSVARGPEYMSSGVVQNVDFVSARLQFVTDSNQSLIDVPISFVIKLRNASVDTFNKIIGNEVYLIGGNRKGYRATLYDIRDDNCTVAVHGEHRMTVKLRDVATNYGMRLNGAVLEYQDLVSFCDMRRASFVTPPPRSVTPPPERIAPSVVHPAPSSAWTSWSDDAPPNDDVPNPIPSSSTPDPWTVNQDDVQDTIVSAIEKLSDPPGPLSWLKEFSQVFLAYHALFKVSPGFFGGRLLTRLVSSQCPDPFCGPNGPAPQGSVAAWCTAKTAGSAVQDYHIPAQDLTPAPPRSKGQECFVLQGQHRGCVQTVAKCSTKNKTVDLFLVPGANVKVTLPMDQVCLVQPFSPM